MDGTHADVAELVIVANRLPVTWSSHQGWVRSPGGLVTALDGLARRRELTWVGHAEPATPPGLTPGWRHGRVHSVDVDPALANEAIDGLANSALWPALHGLREHVRWRSSWWDSYVEYNRRVAEDVASFVRPDSLVWVHDYQLMLLPELLRDIDRRIAVGVSMHTPIDRVSIEALPAAEQLAGGLAAARCIGTQTSDDRDSLREIFDDMRGADLGEPTVFTSPVSIDPAATRQVLDDPVTIGLVDRERKATRDRRLIVSVDRLDYTKGILERMRGYDHAFRKGWITPDEVRIVQATQPTRSTISEYRELRIATERMAHDLTTRWIRSDGSSPFEPIIESIDRRRVAALLSLADICVVTPRRDGMNLVAKEYSILNEAHGGVLVLTRGAGASNALADGSIIVDDVAPASIATALHRATQVPDWERMRWARKRADAVRAWTSLDWADAFIERLQQDVDPYVGPLTRS